MFDSSGLTVSDVDVFEINEAFASQVSGFQKHASSTCYVLLVKLLITCF